MAGLCRKFISYLVIFCEFGIVWLLLNSVMDVKFRKLSVSKPEKEHSEPKTIEFDIMGDSVPMAHSNKLTHMKETYETDQDQTNALRDSIIAAVKDELQKDMAEINLSLEKKLAELEKTRSSNVVADDQPKESSNDAPIETSYQPIDLAVKRTTSFNSPNATTQPIIQPTQTFVAPIESETFELISNLSPEQYQIFQSKVSRVLAKNTELQSHPRVIKAKYENLDYHFPKMIMIGVKKCGTSAQRFEMIFKRPTSSRRLKV